MGCVDAIESGLPPQLRGMVKWLDAYHQIPLSDVPLGSVIEFVNDQKKPETVSCETQTEPDTDLEVADVSSSSSTPMAMPSSIAASSVVSPTHAEHKTSSSASSDDDSSSPPHDDDPNDEDFDLGQSRAASYKRKRPDLSTTPKLDELAGFSIAEMAPPHSTPCQQCIQFLAYYHFPPNRHSDATKRLWLQYLAIHAEYSIEQRVSILARTFTLRELWTLRSLAPVHNSDHVHARRGNLAVRACDTKRTLLRVMVLDPCFPAYLMLSTKQGATLDVSNLSAPVHKSTTRKHAARARARSGNGRFHKDSDVSESDS